MMRPTIQLRWLQHLVALIILTLILVMSDRVVTVSAVPMRQNDEPDSGTTTTITETVSSPTKSAIDLIMYMHSRHQDDEACAMTVEEGELVIPREITNPAMSCPDMFAWKLFIESLQQEFWKNWAPDQYTFPQEGPLPLCSADATDRSACCTPGSLTNPGYGDPQNPGRACPYFPGDHLDADETPDTLEANPPAIAQAGHFQSPVAAPGVEPGRVIRQEMAEVVFRNKPMFDYLFENNLYNTDGLAEVFSRASTAMQEGAPYRQRNVPGELVEIVLPIKSVMIKTNWLNEARAAELGITDDPVNPYIKMTLNSKIIDNNGEIFEAGVHYLVSFHISSKDIPNWVWATFEHVNNPGRCDITGCNDAFGYQSPDVRQPGQYDNYIAPKQRIDNLLIPSTIFDEGKVYTGDVRTPALDAIFTALNIGSSDGDGVMPAATDRGWLSYRLKGSQTTYTDSTGQPTLLGNSVTEGGFVSNSSCMSCHARAAIGPDGHAALDVFVGKLAENGYAQSASGPPTPDWFYSSSAKPTLLALPFDFVWGIFFAQPLTTTIPATTAGTLSTTAAAVADPFAYCAEAGTVDQPQGDFGPSNPGVPDVIATGLMEATGASDDAPVALFAENSYWRCMGGKVYACFGGANLPCASKSDTSTTPTEAMKEFCAAQPAAEVIPANVTGRETVFAWQCVAGKPEAGEQVIEVDEQDYPADFWYEIDPATTHNDE